MNVKKLLKQYLSEEGFCPKEEEEGIVTFKCEGKNFAFIYDDEDEQYFRLMMPGIFEIGEDNREQVLHAMNEVNSAVKVVKAYTMMGNEVWLGFEVLVDSTPIVSDIVPRALAMLNGAARKFFQALVEG